MAAPPDGSGARVPGISSSAGWSCAKAGTSEKVVASGTCAGGGGRGAGSGCGSDTFIVLPPTSIESPSLSGVACAICAPFT